MKALLIITVIIMSLFGLYWAFRALRWLWREWIDVLHEYDDQK